MKAFIKSLDYFSKKFDFTYKGKDRYNTLLGGAITILSTLIIVLNAWLIGKDIYLRENPVVLGYEQALPFFPTTRINYKKIFFSFFLSDNLNNPYEDDSVLKIIPLMYINYYDKNGNLKYKEKFLEYTDCNSEFLRLNITPPLSPSVFLPLQCIKNFDEVLSGFWTDTQLSYLMFKAYSCSNITIEEHTNIQTKDEIKEFEEFENNLKKTNLIKINSVKIDPNYNINEEVSLNYNNVENILDKEKLPKNKTICKPPHEIKKIIPTLYFNFFFTGILVNPKNYTNPMIAQINEDWFNLGTSIFKNIDYFFQNYVVRTDDGLIFNEDYKDLNKIGYYKNFADYLLNEEGQTKIFWLNIYISNQIKYYTREYLKVQNVFANLGGIIQVVLITFRICFSRYFNKKLNLKIINQIFDFDEIPLDKIETRNCIKINNSFLKKNKNSDLRNNNTDLFSSKSIQKIKTNKELSTKKSDFYKEEYQDIINTNNNKCEISEQNNFYSRDYFELERNTKISNQKEYDKSNILFRKFKNLKNLFKNKEIKNKNLYDPKFSLKNSKSKFEENENYSGNYMDKSVKDFFFINDGTKKIEKNESDFRKIENQLIEERSELGGNKKHANKNFDSNEISFNDKKVDLIKINTKIIDKNFSIKNERDKHHFPNMISMTIPVNHIIDDLDKNDLNHNKKLNRSMAVFSKKIDKRRIFNNITGKSEYIHKYNLSNNIHKKINEDSKISTNNMFNDLSNINDEKYESFNKKISILDFTNGVKSIKESSKSIEKDIKSLKIPNIILNRNSKSCRNNGFNVTNINNRKNPQLIEKYLPKENPHVDKIENFFEERIEEAIDFKERKLKYKNFEIFNSSYLFMCCKKKKLQKNDDHYNLAEKNLNKLKDYIVLIKNFQDLTKMKYILFNTNQIYSFPLLSNPKKDEIGVHQENQEYTTAFDLKLTKKELAIKLFSYFKNKIRKDKFGGFDKKIWNILDQQIKNIFIQELSYQN